MVVIEVLFIFWAISSFVSYFTKRPSWKTLSDGDSVRWAFRYELMNIWSHCGPVATYGDIALRKIKVPSYYLNRYWLIISKVSSGKFCKTKFFIGHTSATNHWNNYIIEMETFPDSWAEGIGTSIHKAGARSDPNNFRGITVLPIFKKISEVIVQRRLEFIDDCFLHKDKYNGDFPNDSQTIDNLYVLQSLIERQLSLGQNLIICFIDFSGAFDLMSRHVLFYKLIKSGLHGRVINTLRSLYNKTCFRVKHGGYASESIRQVVGVNQGGNASPIIFRKYMSDMRDYLDENTRVVL